MSFFPGTQRRSLKGYKQLLLYLFDVVLLNTNVVHNLDTNNTQHISEFRLNIILLCCQKGSIKADYHCWSDSGDAPLRLQSKGWAILLTASPNKRRVGLQNTARCAQFMERGQKLCMSVKTCKIPLHLETCI